MRKYFNTFYEFCFWGKLKEYTKKASENERFYDMFAKSVGLIAICGELRLCKAG